MRISLICVIVGIGILSLFPREPSGVELPINDKIGHGIAYFVLMINGGIVMRKKRWTAVGIGAFIYSILLEGVQYFVPGRSTDAYDLIANGTGIIVGLIVLSMFYNRLLHFINEKK